MLKVIQLTPCRTRIQTHTDQKALNKKFYLTSQFLLNKIFQRIHLENINQLEINDQLSLSSHSSHIAPFYHINTHQQQTFGYTPMSIKRKCRIENST